MGRGETPLNPEAGIPSPIPQARPRDAPLALLATVEGLARLLILEFQDGDSIKRALLSTGPRMTAPSACPETVLSLELCQGLGARLVSAEESSGDLLAT